MAANKLTRLRKLRSSLQLPDPSKTHSDASRGEAKGKAPPKRRPRYTGGAIRQQADD